MMYFSVPVELGEPGATACSLGVERLIGKCVGLSLRWRLYQAANDANDVVWKTGKERGLAQGPRWQFYLTPAEFSRTPPPAPVSITAPYPNIGAKRPDQYNAALEAANAYRKVEYFKPFYDRLRVAAENASLALDDRDRVVVQPERTSLLNLLPAEVAKKVGKAAIKETVKYVGGETLGDRAGAILGVLDLLLKLKFIYDSIDAKRLVNEQRHSRRDEAFRFKLRYFITLMVPEAMKKSPFREPVGARNWLENMYWEYDKLFRRWGSFNALEQDLARGTVTRPGYKEPPRMYPYPR